MPEEHWISVKECAQLGKMSTQSVYKKLNHKNNQEILTGHIQTKFGVKYLDEVAVNLILRNRIGEKSTDPIKDELIEIFDQLDKQQQKKILNFAKKVFDVSKY